MRHIKFTVEGHEEFGTGIVPKIFKNWKSYTPSGAYGLAHDLLDHSTKETGEVWQEFKALGANVFHSNFGLRNKTPYFSGTPLSKGDSLGREVEQIYSDANNWDVEINYPQTPKYKLTKGEEAKFAEFEKGFKHGIQMQWEEIFEDLEDCPHLKDLQNILEWIKYGFYRAKRRFKNESAMSDFLKENIKKEVHRKWDALMDYEDSGVEFTISLDYENGYARISHPYGLI